MAKATNAEVKKRIKQVSKMLLRGLSRAEIIQYAAEYWEIEERQVDTYINRANKGFAKSSIFDTSEQLGIASQRLTDLYGKNMRIDDYKAALAVQKELTRLLGIDAPQRIEYKDIGLTDDERLERVAFLLDKARARRDSDTS